MVMGNALRGQIALVHSLCAVFARVAGAAVVDALCLALAAANAGSAGSEGGRANDAGHGGGDGATEATGGKKKKRKRITEYDAMP